MPLLTPYNYYEWKSKMTIYLKRLGLYRVTMGFKIEPSLLVEKPKWHNKCDEAYGTLCMAISPDFLFHVESSTTPNNVCTTLEGLFRKQDELRGHQLENELIGLYPCNFDTIQDFFTTLKALRLQLEECGIEKKDSQLILSILSKFGPTYFVLVSTFYATKSALGNNYIMSSLDEFANELTKERDNLIHMGTIKPSKSHALTANQAQENKDGLPSKKRNKSTKQKRIKKRSFLL